MNYVLHRVPPALWPLNDFSMVANTVALVVLSSITIMFTLISTILIGDDDYSSGAVLGAFALVTLAMLVSILKRIVGAITKPFEAVKSATAD